MLFFSFHDLRYLKDILVTRKKKSNEKEQECVPSTRMAHSIIFYVQWTVTFG